MSLGFRQFRFFWGWVRIGVGVGLGGMVASQCWLGRALAQETNAPKLVTQAPALPLPAVAPRSPVDYFRELLAMNFAERNRALADRPPDARKQILAKVREYEAMKPNARELRLRATELRWYLLRLMRTSPTNRIAQLERVPSDMRPLIDSRLKEWDALTPEVQTDFLKHEAALQAYTCLQATNTNPQANARTNIPAELQAVSEPKLNELLARYDFFMGLSEAEKKKTLETVSDPERAQIEKTLQKFENLTPEQRAACVRSFMQFKRLTPEERRQFLSNAVKWSRMNPDERKQWQDLVDRQQLLPPSIVPTSPLPPPARSRRAMVEKTPGPASQESYVTNK
jgi:hypothetical protein